MDRKLKALEILKKYKNQNYYYLGEGFSGIVFHDNQYVYKVHISKANNYYGEMDGLAYLISKINIFNNSKHFYPLTYFKIDNVFILKYKYEKSQVVNQIKEEEFISFLSEMWNKKIICKSITKEKNFIRVNGQLKFIDYEILPYNDNLFLNTAARAYLYIRYPNETEKKYNRLKRSIINNLMHPAIEDFHSFLKKIFLSVSLPNSFKIEKSNFNTVKLNEKTIWQSISNNKFIYNFFLENYFVNNDLKTKITPQYLTLKKIDKKVTLLIKACPQDSPMLYVQVKHIVYQLSSPTIFFEKVVAIDKKEKNFLREYTNEGSLEQLYQVLNKLIEEGIIDYFIELPDSEIETTNLRWFGLKSSETHTINNIPVTPQIYAFEKTQGDYILQLDSDVLIGRLDYNHSFLIEMIEALEQNTDAISVGFNIYKDSKKEFIDYHAPLGGYKPEVRFALIHKHRLLEILPLPNELVNNKLKLGWYHALHLYQKKNNKFSLRGGDRRSFYIHPQNYRKKCKYVWFIIMDRIEKNIIPKIQFEKFDLEGSFYDWSIPKRSEKLVILTVINIKTDINKFIRFYETIKNQSIKKNNTDVGILILNTDPNYLKDKIIWSYLKNEQNVTYVHTKIDMTNMEALYIGIHYFIKNLDSFILLCNPNDFLVGKHALSEVYERLKIYKGDILIGKSLNNELLKSAGYFYVDFVNTDIKNNLFYYPKVFKKSLFEKLGLFSLKEKIHTENKINNFDKINKKYKWFEDEENVYLFNKLMQLSDNPIRFDFINCFSDRRINKNKIIKIYNKLKYSEKKNILTNSIENNRIHFPTNLNQIEIDITYDCNLKCISCNRSCTQAPSKTDYMTINQIRQFIKESIEVGKKWKLINILGGEPTLHPDFEEIINLIYKEYILKFSPGTTLQITSNGYTGETRRLLQKFEKHSNIIIDKNSFKDSNKIDYFTPFNLAPIDDEKFKDMDFSKGCWVASYCGIGLNKYGYYPCGVAGGIDRVIGLDKGIKSLKEVSDRKMDELKNIFCRYCGNYKDYHVNFGNFIPRCEKAPLSSNELYSFSWKNFYKKFKLNKPKLTKIYE